MKIFTRLLFLVLMQLAFFENFAQSTSGQQCFASPTKPGIVSAKSVWTVDQAAQTVTIRTSLSKTFVDNSYGANAIGWPGNNHSFNHLVTSDMLQLALYSGDGTKALEFKMDYFSLNSTNPLYPNGYGTSGVTSNDGAMLVGSASNILSVRTSLSEDFKKYGPKSGSNDFTVSSPAANANYVTTDPTYNDWIFDVWYEVTVKLSAFGTSGFKMPAISGLHASPSKTGNDSETVTPVPCSNTESGSIGDLVWYDANKNGIQDLGELGIPGVAVSIAGANGFSNTTTTNASGLYKFSNLPSGTYTITFTTPSGYTPTIANQGSDNTKDSNPVDGAPVTVTLTANQNDLSIDAGYCGKSTASSGKIGDFVWKDLNKNGIQDAGEPGLQGVTVKLTFQNGTTATTTTNSNGFYQFTGLVAGTYTVAFTTPSGYAPTAPNVGSDETKDSDADNGAATVTIADNEVNNNIDAGFTLAVPQTANCEDFNAGFGAGGSDLYPRLPRDGSYQVVKSVNQLGGGGYLDIHSPSGGYFLAAHTSNDASDRVWYTTIKVVPGKTYKFCTSVTLLKNLGDGANYILGLYVNGQSIGTGRVTFDWTQICGTYTVPDGVYSIELSLRDPKKGLFFVAVDDICATPQLATNLTLGNQVWNDFDGDGHRDSNEPGIGGVTISLYTDNDGDNMPDGPAIKTTMTDALGHYRFTNLTEGRYIASMPILPGYQQSPNDSLHNYRTSCLYPDNNVDNDNNLVRLVGPNGPGGILYTNAITLTAGEEPIDDGDGPNGNNTLDLAECGNSFIGDFVWNDINGNGIQDAGEPGINDVLVTITFEDGRTGSTLTHKYDAANNPNDPIFDGYYNFPNLGPGTYKISFTTPAGLYPSPPNQGDDAKDSDPVNGAPVKVTIAADESNFTIDAGFTSIAPPPPATCPNLSVGNMVFNDVNSNGVKDADEQGIVGLTVKLYADNDGDNVPDGAAIATTVTAADGTYYFSNIAAGSYIVGVTTGSAYVQDTFADATADDNKDNDNNGIRTINGEVRSNAITLSAGDEPVNDGSDNNSNLTLDFGLKTAPPCTEHCDCHNDCNHTGCGHANCAKNGDEVTTTALSVFPNPASNYFQVKVDATKSGVAQIRITDAAGHIVLSKDVTISVGSNNITFSDLGNLKSGSYNVQVLFNYHVYNEQLMLVK